jgi:large subunit ribosomal protein L29
MKTSELRQKSVTELRAHLEQLRKDQFGYRMQKSTGQLGQTHLAGALKRDIARVKTIITEKQKSGS